MFEFRGSIEFKNVPEPVKCYYLVDNLDKDDSVPIIVPDENVAFQFMMTPTHTTPPPTPLVAEKSLADVEEILSLPSSEPAPIFHIGSSSSFSIPDFNVIKPTPNSTPRPSPQHTKNNGIEDEHFTFSSTKPPAGCPFFMAHAQESDTTGSCISVEDDDTLESTSMTFVSPSFSLSEPSDGEQQQLQKTTDFEYHHFHPHSLLSSVRHTSMSPLQEDLNEESLTLSNLDEGIDLQRKISDVSNCSSESGGGVVVSVVSQDKKDVDRKTSDTSNHSTESGIESAPDKRSPMSIISASKEGVSSVDARKLSSSSNASMEEELATIRHQRAGVVSKVIEQYDHLTRQRKSGLPMVACPKMNNVESKEKSGAATSPKSSQLGGSPTKLSSDMSQSKYPVCNGQVPPVPS